MEQRYKRFLSTREEAKNIVISLNIKEIVKKLIVIMKSHIGQENKISKLNLFKKVYNTNPEDVSELKEWIMFEFIKRAMHRMRQRTKCFIVSKPFPVSKFSSKGQGIWHYWVACDMSDYDVYRGNINRNIKAMKNMVRKCERSVANEWYKEDWSYA